MKARHSWCLAALAVMCLTTAAPRAAEPPYSAEPYAKPIRDAVENAVEFTKFNNWLNANFEAAPRQQQQALKEHLYSVIDSHVKQLHAKDGRVLPAEKDMTLSLCFAWATRMGVQGAHSVLETLDPELAAEVSASAGASASFNLAMKKDRLVLASNWGGWTMSFPYHFMVGAMQDFEAKNGLRTQLTIISTGFARHSAREGHSQATVSVVYSPEGTRDQFQGFWAEAFGLKGVAAKPIDGRPTYRKLDRSTNMHSELIFLEIGKGHLAIAYMGLAGTYEHNRPHFQDLMANLQIAEGATPTGE